MPLARVREGCGLRVQVGIWAHEARSAGFSRKVSALFLWDIRRFSCAGSHLNQTHWTARGLCACNPGPGRCRLCGPAFRPPYLGPHSSLEPWCILGGFKTLEVWDPHPSQGELGSPAPAPCCLV